MKTETFHIRISAPRGKVWAALFEDTNYREWAAAFAEGSWAKTDWKEGSKALFLDANNEGMLSRIARNIPNEFLSIEHLGEVRKGEEITGTPETESWAGAHENYRLSDAGGKTELTVELENKGMPQDMLDYFMAAWPKALDIIKAIAERG